LTNLDLAQSYTMKAKSRLKTLDVLLGDANYSDIIREAQEAVEVATKAMLRRAGIDPRKWHDVGPIILEHLAHFPSGLHADLAQAARISKALRKERELSFYGEVDFVPSEEYTREQAAQAIADAGFVVELAAKLIG
jgi:HEPN domain-containing protein